MGPRGSAEGGFWGQRKELKREWHALLGGRLGGRKPGPGCGQHLHTAESKLCLGNGLVNLELDQCRRFYHANELSVHFLLWGEKKTSCLDFL